MGKVLKVREVGDTILGKISEEIPITAMINPTWKNLSEDIDVQYEGCMSVPSIRGKVERYKNFAQDKYSNRETTLQILEDNIEPDKLYLLDEPEVSLSPQNQVKSVARCYI